jgi:hypothetical protein
MTTMTRHTVVENAWTEVAATTVRCFLQLHSGTAVLVHVGASAPAADSLVGIVMESGEVPELSLDQLETGDRVFVRGIDGGAVVLAVTAAEAPA